MDPPGNRVVLRLFRQAFNEFNADECPRLAASLAFYAIFSMPPLLVLLVWLTSLIADRALVVERLSSVLSEVMGRRVAEQVAAMLPGDDPLGHGLWRSLVALVMLLVGASGVLSELQTALNRAWDVQPVPGGDSLRTMLVKRVLSLGMVLGMSVLLLASLAISWFLAALGTFTQSQAPGMVSPQALQWVDQLSSLAVLTLLFAASFRYLPDVRLDWTDVWSGSLLTALLFVVGKVVLSMYLAWADPTTAYGAAGSLALVLIWIYYSSMIYFYGAEFTQVHARSRGKRVQAELGARITRHARANAAT
jgi:membrane protein